MKQRYIDFISGCGGSCLIELEQLAKGIEYANLYNINGGFELAKTNLASKLKHLGCIKTNASSY